MAIDLPTLAFISLVVTVISLVVFWIGVTRSRSAGRQFIVWLLVIFVIGTYVVFRISGVFQSVNVLGARDDLWVLGITAVAVLIGIVISALVEAGSVSEFHWEALIIPIVASPLFVAPVWSMYTDLNLSTPDFRHYVTFFFSGVTSGFTWRTILDKLRK